MTRGEISFMVLVFAIAFVSMLAIFESAAYDNEEEERIFRWNNFIECVDRGIEPEKCEEFLVRIYDSKKQTKSINSL